MAIDRTTAKSGQWGPYRQASPPPARHRPGARSARRERCLSILSQTGREAMKRYSSAAGLALAVVAVLGLTGPAAAGDQVPFKGHLGGDVTTMFDPASGLLDVDIDATG